MWNKWHFLLDDYLIWIIQSNVHVSVFYLLCASEIRGCGGRDRLVVGFITTLWVWARSGEMNSMQHYVIKFVNDRSVLKLTCYYKRGGLWWEWPFYLGDHFIDTLLKGSKDVLYHCSIYMYHIWLVAVKVR